MLPFTHQLGTTHRSIAIAKELRKNGHEVVFAGEGKYLDIIAREKFAIKGLIEIDHDYYLKNLDKASLGFHTEKTIEQFVKEEIKLFKTVRPDLVVDEMRLTDSISTKVIGIPKIAIMNTILTKHYAIPITVPETHWLFSIKKLSALAGKYLDLTANIIKDSYHHQWVKPYNKIAKEFNIPGWNNLYEILKGDYTILSDPPEFAPIEENLKNVYQVGPIVHNTVSKEPKWLKEIDKRHKTVIYCSLGSTGLHYKKIYAFLFDIFANDERYQIISNTTKLFDPERLKKAKNFYVTRLTPATKMMKKSSIAIIHGGLGTIYHALYIGIPILGIPYQAEQEWNLDRVKTLGLGEKLNRKDLNLYEFKQKIPDIINNKNIQKRLYKFRKILVKYKGAKTAAEIIEKIAHENISLKSSYN